MKTAKLDMVRYRTDRGDRHGHLLLIVGRRLLLRMVGAPRRRWVKRIDVIGVLKQ